MQYVLYCTDYIRVWHSVWRCEQTLQKIFIHLVTYLHNMYICIERFAYFITCYISALKCIVCVLCSPIDIELLTYDFGWWPLSYCIILFNFGPVLEALLALRYLILTPFPYLVWKSEWVSFFPMNKMRNIIIIKKSAVYFFLEEKHTFSSCYLYRHAVKII